MLHAGLRLLTGLCRPRRLGWGLLVLGAPLLALGCRQSDYSVLSPSSSPRLSTPPFLGDRPAHPSSELQQVAYQAEKAPVPQGASTKTTDGPVLPPVTASPGQTVPLDLVTVLRLAETQNAEIALGREKVNEAKVQTCSCDGHFMRKIMDCIAPGRHAQAEANVWQQMVELSKVTSDTLQEAGSTYIDLLSARQAEVIGKEMETYLLAILRRVENLQKGDVTATVMLEAVQTEVYGRREALVKFHQQGDAATAKLAHLLGLPPEAVMAPVDAAPVPIDLVDQLAPASALIARAQANGPGVRELQGLLGAIHHGMALLKDHRMMGECQVQKQRAQAQSKAAQVELALRSLTSKLAVGVQEARDASAAGRWQIEYGTKMIEHAKETYRLSDLRLKENAPGATVNEVLQAIRALEQAYSTRLTAIAGYNKAQIRLSVLLGPAPTKEPEIKHVMPVQAVTEGPEGPVLPDLEPVPANAALSSR